MTRKPKCRQCNGDGWYYGHFTINPSEKEQRIECRRCDGTGYEPKHEPDPDT